MGSLTTTTTTTTMKGPMKACRQVIGFNPCSPFHHYRAVASDIHNNEGGGVGGLLSISTIATGATTSGSSRPYDLVSPCARRSGLQALLAADRSPPPSPPPSAITSSSSSSPLPPSVGTLPICSGAVGTSCTKPAMASSSSSSSSSSSVGTSLYSRNTVGFSCSKPAMASSSSSSSSSVGTSLYSCYTSGVSCSKPTMAPSSSSLSVGTSPSNGKPTAASCSKPAMAISSSSSSSSSDGASLYSCNTVGFSCSKPAMASSPSVGTLLSSRKPTVASCGKPAAVISSSSPSAGTLPASCRASEVGCKNPAAVACSYSSSSHEHEHADCHIRKKSFFFISTPDPDLYLPESLDACLDACLLCKRCLVSTEDIFVYRGGRAFCSEDCRSKHIFMNGKEEEEEEKTSEEFTKLIIQHIVGYQNRSRRLIERAVPA